MKTKFILNDTVLFEPDKNSLTSLHATPVQKIILHTPASECLRQLLLHNGQVVSQKLLFGQVWEKNGAFVTVNTLYQNIVSVRKGLKAAGIAEDVIKTLPKTGFKISVTLKELNDEIAASPVDEKLESTGERSEGDVQDEKKVIKKAPQISSQNFFRFNKTHCLRIVIVAFIFIALWALFYQKYPAGRSYYAGYYFAGNVNGCQLYSSHPGNEKSKDIFLFLLNRHPIQCQPDAVAYMTVNRMYEVSSIIMCDKNITEDDAQCKSFLFRGAQDKK